MTQFRFKLEVKLVTHERSEVLDIWKEKLFSKKSVQSLRFADYQYHFCLTEMNDPFTNERIWMYEVELSIKRTKLTKALGFGNIPNKMFKNTYSIQFICSLFNLLFSNLLIPNEWRTALINPIPKHSKKDRIDPLQYRGGICVA